MASDRVVATDANGYLFQLPSLGLPDPAGQWVQVCGAIGDKVQCVALVEKATATDAPLRHSNPSFDLLEVEFQGAVWRLPTSLHTPSASLPQLSSTRVQRLPAATALPSDRPKLPDDIHWIYMNKQQQQLEMGEFKWQWKDGHGYCFRLPALNEPGPGGEWVHVRAAIGTKEACNALLLKRNPPEEEPIRKPGQELPVFEIQYEDAVWMLPLLPPRRCAGEVDVFTAKAWRIPTELASSQRRPQIPVPVRTIFLNPSDRSLECTLEGIGVGDASCMEDSELFRTCIDPTSAQCDPSTFPPRWAGDPISPADSEEMKRIKQAKEDAWEAWYAMGKVAINEEWRKEVFHDAVAAGLRKSPITDEGKPFLRLRVSHEPDLDYRGIDYALCAEDDHSPSKPDDWLPVPPHAFTPEFVRCGVNLMRMGLRKRLIPKAEWPPPPTTLMRLKGDEGGRSRTVSVDAYAVG